jgi:hypothetical protein
MARQRGPLVEQIVNGETGRVVERFVESGERQQEGLRLDQVGRDLEQHGALAQGFATR